MNTRWHQMRSTAPLLFGSGRAFSVDAGSLSAVSRALPTPATLAGAVRSWRAMEEGWQNEEADRTKELCEVTVNGPLLLRDGDLCLTPPLDAVLLERRGEEGKAVLSRLRPTQPESGGALLPEGWLPCMAEKGLLPTKAEMLPCWLWSELLNWLKEEELSLPEKREGPRSESRTHVGLDSDTKANKKGRLFSTEGRWFDKVLVSDKQVEEWSLAFRTQSPEGIEPWVSPIQTLGGDRRTVRLTTLPDAPPWASCPSDLANLLVGSKKIRLILATPGLFADGRTPSLDGLPLKGRVVSACVGRPDPLNRWNRTRGRFEEGGPKPQHWMTPPGSVFFIELDSPLTADQVSQLWLASISDSFELGGPDTARSLGFGLALLGAWNKQL